MASRSSTDSSLRSERLLDKVAVVTGGANGIGESIVRSFLGHGAKVCVADIQDDAGRRLVESLRRDGVDDVTYCHCDVTVEEDVERAVDKYGSLDIMVNNAGIAGSFPPDIRGADMSTLERVLGVNVKGVFAGLKQAARAMVPNKRGSIISTCSVAGVMGGAGSHAYTASKHAVLGLTRGAAAELGQHGIRVNCVSPYGIITALSVSVMPEHVRVDQDKAAAAMGHVIERCANLKGVKLTAGDAVVYLASGATLVVDGGFSAVTNGFSHLGQWPPAS